jgi:hypothetical protein
MKPAMSLRWTLAVAICVLAPSIAAAQPKPKAVSACGQRLLPLKVGNQWVFEPGKPPTDPPEAMVRIIPVQPRKLTITVVGIETVAGKSVVTLEEDADGRKATTTITCGGGKFEASLDSVFFAGEPGGVYNIQFDKLERKLVDGTPFAAGWREDLIATWKRNPSEGVQAELGTGRLEVERKFTLAPGTEQIGVPWTQAHPKQASARKLGIELTGRVAIDGLANPQEMPANWINYIWFVDGVGPIQILNSYFHLYMLSDATLVK